MTNLYLPGYLARSHSYQPGLPPGWDAVQAPMEVRAAGALERHAEWIVGEVRRRGSPATLAGHSMGSAVAVLAAARSPEDVSRVILVAPSTLPISKPVSRIAYDFLRNVAVGRFRLADVVPPLGDFARYPGAAWRLARTLRGLDLSAEMAGVRRAGIPSTVIGCATDTLTTPELTRRTAELLGAEYRELELDGGHVWMFGRWDVHRAELERAMVDAPKDPGGAPL